MDISSALPTFVVTLREGFEASLQVGIILACLVKAKQTQLNRWVYQGASAGFVACVMLGLFFWEILQGIQSTVVKELLEGGFGVVAIVMLSWMLIWMTQQAKSLQSDVEKKISQALADPKRGKLLVFLLVFIVVLKEGFEAVIYIATKFEQDWFLAGLGAISGVIVAVILGFLIFKWGINLNIRLFFQIMGFFVLFIVGGLVIGALRHFDTAAGLISTLSTTRNLCLNWGQSCILGPLVFDLSKNLSDQQYPGALLKSLLGYRDQVYLIQGIAYLLFIAIVGGLYFWNVLVKIPQFSTVSKSS